jgi:transmembrane sensor
MIFSFQFRHRRAAKSARINRIEEAAADWLARREAGFSSAEQLAFSRWQSADPDHAAAVKRLASSWRRMQQPRAKGQADELLGAIEARIAQRARRSRRWRTAAAILTPLAAAAMLMLAVFPARPESDISEPAGFSVVIHPERRQLSDGSVVELNAGAEITVDFSAESRALRLVRGEAHFAVAKDARRPFVVTAGLVTVRAVGTEFAVRLAGEEIGVLVTEGRVAVEQLTEPPPPAASTSEVAARPAGAAKALLTFVDAGNQIQVPAVVPATSWPQPSPLTPTATQAALAWRDQRVEFSDTPLAEIVAHFNRQNPVQLVLGGEAVGRIRISGIFWANDPEAFARLMQASAGLHVDRADTDRIMLRR